MSDNSADDPSNQQVIHIREVAQEEEGDLSDDEETPLFVPDEFQECPACGVMTEKHGGCNVITCLAMTGGPASLSADAAPTACGHRWCWICRKHKGATNTETECAEASHRLRIDT